MIDMSNILPVPVIRYHEKIYRCSNERTGMKYLPCIIVLLAILITAGCVSQNTMVPKVTVYFFYGEECPHCHDVMPFIRNLSLTIS